jgi:hypothetical protein
MQDQKLSGIEKKSAPPTKLTRHVAGADW